RSALDQTLRRPCRADARPVAHPTERTPWIDPRIQKGHSVMVEGSVAPVTGPKRGLGAAFADARCTDAATVDAAGSDASAVIRRRVSALRLDLADRACKRP